MLTKLLSISIIVGVSLVGCGGETTVQNMQDVSMPHQVDMTPKNSREFNPEGEEYLNFMKTYNLNSRAFKVTNGLTELYDYFDLRNQNLKYAFYYDTDHNKETGYYDKWVPKVGADYLVENGILFRYTGTPGTHEWSWEAVRYLGDYVYIHRHGFLDFIGYGVILNQDYTQNSFLGYYDTNLANVEENIYFSQVSDRKFTITADNENIYLHSYRKDNKKLNPNEAYYNYNFSIGGINYETQGNTLFNAENEIITDNLLYEVRDYEAITIIPKTYLNAGSVNKINSATIRDNNWNELLKLNNGITNTIIKEKILNDIKEKDQNARLIEFDFASILDNNYILVYWVGTNQNQPYLSKYNLVDGNINFNKHLIDIEVASSYFPTQSYTINKEDDYIKIMIADVPGLNNGRYVKYSISDEGELIPVEYYYGEFL